MKAFKCPFCKESINHANVNGIDLHETGLPSKKLDGVAYTCPSCNTILSIGCDALALRSGIKDDMIDLLRALVDNRI